MQRSKVNKLRFGKRLTERERERERRKSESENEKRNQFDRKNNCVESSEKEIRQPEYFRKETKIVKKIRD